MTRILLVRHGRTEWNQRRLYRGTADVPLDAQGRREAACARDWLRDETVHAAYASPLSRARETATIILEPHGVPVLPHAGLTDLDYGDWQGRPAEEAESRFPEIAALWRSSPQSVTFPNGEGLADVRARVVCAVEEIANGHPQQTVLVAAHRVVNKVLICALLGLDDSHFWQIGQDTAALNELTYQEETWVCRLLNGTCHLRGLEGRVTADF